jgi:hydrogenase maturation protease
VVVTLAISRLLKEDSGSMNSDEIMDGVRQSRRPLLILGIGNYLMGDEGVGVHAIRRLEKVGLPRDVALLDGGTGGFQLLSFLQEYDPIIMIDATMDGNFPGTVSLLQPKFAHDFPRSLSAHDIGLRDLLESASLLGPLPKIHLITVTVQDLNRMSTELSAPVEGALPGVVEAVLRLIREEGY